jgi:YegS/Rv2252/BmrU family lipid kinase
VFDAQKTMKVRVIVNPQAGAGAARRKVPAIVRALRAASIGFDERDVVFTSGPGDATQLARAARDDGATIIAVVGGDGTLHEVTQAYLDSSGTPLPGPDLGMIPAGTGGDFRKTLGLDESVERAVHTLLSAPPRPVDLGVVSYTTDAGRPETRAFVNIASFGVSGKVDRLVNATPKWMGGKMAFAVGTLRGLATYRNAPVSVRVDDTPFYEGPMNVTAIGNGRCFGGGMQIAPHADPGDGLFDVVVVGDIGFLESVRRSPELYKGEHIGKPMVFTRRGRRVVAEPLTRDPVYIDTDGEAPGKLPLTAEVLPGALRFRA